MRRAIVIKYRPCDLGSERKGEKMMMMKRELDVKMGWKNRNACENGGEKHIYLLLCFVVSIRLWSFARLFPSIFFRENIK